MQKQKKSGFKCSNKLCNKKISNINKSNKTNSGIYCMDCIKKQRKQRRKEILKLSEEQGWEYTTAWKNKKKKKETTLPKITSVKQINKKVSTKGLYLTKNEKNLLYRKYRSEGLDSDSASKRIKGVVLKMQELIERLRGKKKSEEDINIKFKEEFRKLVESGSEERE